MNNAKKTCFSVKVCKIPAHCVKWRIQNPTAFRIVMCFRKSFWLRCVQNIQPNLTCLIIVTSCCCAAYNRTVVIQIIGANMTIRLPDPLSLFVGLIFVAGLSSVAPRRGASVQTVAVG